MLVGTHRGIARSYTSEKFGEISCRLRALKQAASGGMTAPLPLLTAHLDSVLRNGQRACCGTRGEREVCPPALPSFSDRRRHATAASRRYRILQRETRRARACLWSSSL